LQWLAGCIGPEADMPERAGARLWVSIVAAVIMLPAAVVLLLAAWAIRVQIAPPMLTDPSPVTLAAAPSISPVQEKVEAAMPPQRETTTEPVALPPQAPEPSSTMPTLAEASPADADRAQDALPSAVPMMAGKPAAPEPSEPIAGPVAPMPAQVAAAVPPPPATAAEPVAPAPDAKAPEFASASSLFATLAVVPPILGRASPAYADPTPDTFASVAPMMTAKPATPELAEPISEPVPLPKPKPHVTIAHVGHAVPLPRPRPELIR
jgi:hypothetical protein